MATEYFRLRPADWAWDRMLEEGQGRRGSGRALGRLAARREEIWAPEVPAITACRLTAPPAETDGVRARPAWGDADQIRSGGGGLDLGCVLAYPGGGG